MLKACVFLSKIKWKEQMTPFFFFGHLLLTGECQKNKEVELYKGLSSSCQLCDQHKVGRWGGG